METKKTLGDRAFSALWNKLLKEIRRESNFNKFKTLLKTYSSGRMARHNELLMSYNGGVFKRERSKRRHNKREKARIW